MQSKNNTNVRSFDGLVRTDQESAADTAAKLFLTAPPRRTPKPVERALFDLATRSELRVDGERIPIFRFGTGPAVLLLHGWGGSSGQLHTFVEPLLLRGASVVAFDAPAHGEATGTWLAIPRFAEALRAVACEVGPIRGVIGHSMGAAAAAFATAAGFAPERMVLIGPPASELEMFRTWAKSLGFDDALIERAKLRVEARVGVSFERLGPQPMAATISAPLLVVHDREDAEVPWADGAAIAAAAPNGRLLSTSGLGHRRILRDPKVVQTSVDFAVGLALRTESVDAEASNLASV